MKMPGSADADRWRGGTDSRGGDRPTPPTRRSSHNRPQPQGHPLGLCPVATFGVLGFSPPERLT
jgi:hypothetical protein